MNHSSQDDASGISIFSNINGRYGVELVLLTLIYFLSSKIGLFLEAEYGGITPIWPPSGIAAAVFWVRGFRYWPMIVIGEFSIALSLQQPPLAGIIGGLAQTLEATMVIVLLRNRRAKKITSSARSVLWFSLLGVLIPPLFSSVIGSSTLWSLGFLDGSEYMSGFLIWWLGDAIAILVITPILVDLDSWPIRNTTTFFYYLCFTLVTVAICLAIILIGNEKSYYLFFILIPFVVVSAVHFTLVGAGSAIVLLAIIVFGMRPQDLAEGDFITAIRMAFVGTSAFTGYLVTGFMEKRQQRLALIHRQNKYLNSLHEVVLGLVTYLEIDKLLEAIVSHACELLGTQNGYLFKKESETGVIKLIVGKGIYADVLGYEVKPGEGVAGQVWSSGQTLMINHYHEWEGRHPDALWDTVTAIIGVPIKVYDDVVGVLGVLHTDKNKQFTDDDLNIIQQFGELASVVWKNALMYSDLTDLLEARQRAEKALAISEKTHREIFNSTSEAMLVLDMETGKILQTNDAAEKIFGEKINFTGTPFSDLIKKYGLPYSENQVISWAKTHLDQAPWISEWHSQCEQIKGAWFEITLKKAMIQDAACILAVIRDITEHKIIKQQLIQAQKMEAIGTLASGIAHDFNNILAGIIGHSELALNFTLTPNHPATENVEEILRAGKRAADLVKQILTFSHSTEVEHKPIDVNSITKEVIKFIASSLPPTIELETDLSAKHSFVLASPTYLHQVLMNLITNAMHAIPNDKGRISVCLSNTAIASPPPSNLDALSPGEYLELSVSDTGSGMDAATIEKIFEPYFTTKESGKGTGLGLSVVHGIVNSLSGSITVESKEGKGTTFRVFLPVDMHSKKTREEDEVVLPHGNETILFVDDNPLLTDITTQLLNNLGYQVAVFADSCIALDHFKNDPTAFQLIITDMLMPEMTGIDLGRAIKSINPQIPIIICTGNPNNISQADVKDIGISEVAKKPLNLNELAVLIRSVLDN